MLHSDHINPNAFDMTIRTNINDKQNKLGQHLRLRCISPHNYSIRICSLLDYVILSHCYLL
jgi:hypothetical protein